MDDSLSPVIVADVFEEGSGVPASLQRLGARVVVEPLSAGDYRISGGALIERKTVADLHGSLGRGRLWSQIGRVRDAAVLPFLFVEGPDIDDGPRHPNAIRGCLLAIADLGIAVVRSRDPADTAQWLHRLAIRQERRQRAPTPTPRRRVPPPGPFRAERCSWYLRYDSACAARAVRECRATPRGRTGRMGRGEWCRAGQSSRARGGSPRSRQGWCASRLANG